MEKLIEGRFYVTDKGQVGRAFRYDFHPGGAVHILQMRCGKLVSFFGVLHKLRKATKAEERRWFT